MSESELAFPTQILNAITIRNLRFVFHIEKSLSSEPNTCDISIFNLDGDTKKELQKLPIYVRIESGFDGNLQRIFTGDLRWSSTVNDGVTPETRFQVADGDRSYRKARVFRSYRGGVTIKDAVSETARSMGLRAKFSPTAERELLAQFTGGLSLGGLANRELTRLLTPVSMTWSIQDGILQILRNDEVSVDEILVISPETGLIGSPEFGSPPEKGKLPVLTVECLIKPALKPGARIQIESSTISGIYRIERVIHDFDTHGPDPAISLIEARQV